MSQCLYPLLDTSGDDLFEGECVLEEGHDGEHYDAAGFYYDDDSFISNFGEVIDRELGLRPDGRMG
jgi:hypothetical protein